VRFLWLAVAVSGCGPPAQRPPPPIQAPTNVTIADPYPPIHPDPVVTDEVHANTGTPTTATIHGTLVGDNGEPMIGCTVVASSPSLLITQTAITDEHGTYSIASLPGGTYAIMYYWECHQFEHKNLVLAANTETFERVSSWNTQPGDGRGPARYGECR
jgi:hypothetical protein